MCAAWPMYKNVRNETTTTTTTTKRFIVVDWCTGALKYSHNSLYFNAFRQMEIDDKFLLAEYLSLLYYNYKNIF